MDINNIFAECHFIGLNEYAEPILSFHYGDLDKTLTLRKRRDGYVLTGTVNIGTSFFQDKEPWARPEDAKGSRTMYLNIASKESMEITDKQKDTYFKLLKNLKSIDTSVEKVIRQYFIDTIEEAEGRPATEKDIEDIKKMPTDRMYYQMGLSMFYIDRNGGLQLYANPMWKRKEYQAVIIHIYPSVRIGDKIKDPRIP